MLLSTSSQVAVSGYPAFTHSETLEEVGKAQPYDVQYINGEVYVAYRGSDEIGKFDASGTYSTLFGGFGSGAGQLSAPESFYYNTTHYVVVETNNRRLQVFDSSYTSQQLFGSVGSGNDQFNDPKDITSNGTHYFVADWANHRVQVFELDLTYVATIGSGSASTADGEFTYAASVLYYNSLLYVADYGNQRVQKFDSNLNMAGAFWTGTSPLDLTVIDGRIAVSHADPYGISIFENDELVMTLGGIDTTGSNFLQNEGIDYNGTHLFVADTDQENIDVFEYHPDGIVATETQQVTQTQQITTTEVAIPTTTVTSTHVITTEVTNAKSEAPVPLIPIFIAILSITAFRFTRKK